MDTTVPFYLSGPMTGYDGYNYQYFGEVKEFLELCGLTIESPHENPWPEGHDSMDVGQLWQYMMELCFKQMDKCEGIILLRGWAESRGAWLELDRMRKAGKPVYYFDDDTQHVICMNRRQEV
jgi:nucleoside 2-deoxyribosyltransferase